MEEDIFIRCKEEDTDIVYTYHISREDAEKIVDNEGAEHFKIEGGSVGFRGEIIVIMKQSSAAFFKKREIIRQIEDQL